MYNTSLNRNDLNISANMSKNLFTTVLVFLFFKQYGLSENSNNLLTNSSFYLPKKKKSVIFLRAPYKNKLARLNILNLEFTSIVILKINAQVSYTQLIKIFKLGSVLFSTTKIKHTKTKINFITTNKNNFKLSNFN